MIVNTMSELEAFKAVEKTFMKVLSKIYRGLEAQEKKAMKCPSSPQLLNK